MPTNTLWFLNLSVSATAPRWGEAIWENVLNPRCRDSGVASLLHPVVIATSLLSPCTVLPNCWSYPYLIIIHKILTKFTTGFSAGNPAGFSAEFPAGFLQYFLQDFLQYFLQDFLQKNGEIRVGYSTGFPAEYIMQDYLQNFLQDSYRIFYRISYRLFCRIFS